MPVRPIPHVNQSINQDNQFDLAYVVSLNLRADPPSLLFLFHASLEYYSYGTVQVPVIGYAPIQWHSLHQPTHLTRVGVSELVAGMRNHPHRIQYNAREMNLSNTLFHHPRLSLHPSIHRTSGAGSDEVKTRCGQRNLSASLIS